MRNFIDTGSPRRGLSSVKLFFAVATLVLAGAANAQIATAPSDDRFIAGEAVSISVPLDTGSFLNGGYAIDSAGWADLPVLGRVEIAGKTRAQVEEFLAQKLSNYLKDTHIRAIPAIRLTLLGHFTRQGQYYVSPKATVWEAVYEAGGMAGERTLEELRVLRGEQELKIKLLDEYSRARPLAAAGVRSGDIFVMDVPRDNTGAWYWFRETLSATAQVATIASTILTAYITYLLLERSNNP